jgi:hypothetical protein
LPFPFSRGIILRPVADLTGELLGDTLSGNTKNSGVWTGMQQHLRKFFSQTVVPGPA